ncbi:hypothetical protein [Paracoccus sp. AS002]|uniref:hypothetical protein n=1 Tax=Paracoccus sp. AS002 TaxID=3019545 RepID=UPI0023E7D2E7|nr:hypothetical protein [Paracoccus sp. AS002]MDF3904683.1 hypothetical protein [Paracoccus sp. AS002]
MADFPIHDSPERRKPLTGRQKAAQRETARKARQAERRHNHEQERAMRRQINEGRYEQD